MQTRPPRFYACLDQRFLSPKTLFAPRPHLSVTSATNRPHGGEGAAAGAAASTPARTTAQPRAPAAGRSGRAEKASVLVDEALDLTSATGVTDSTSAEVAFRSKMGFWKLSVKLFEEAIGP